MLFEKILKLDAKYSDAIRIKDPETNRFKPFAAFFAHSGDSWFIEIALFILWLFTRGEFHNLLALTAGAVALLALLVLGIKFTIRRQRPEGEWGAIYRNTDPHSFPSGHAARTAMMAVLALLMGFPGLGFGLMVWMILVSLARVWMGVHYLSDVIAGVLFGALFAWVMAALAPWFYTLLPWIFSDHTSLIAFKFFFLPLI
jgi:undecaprenyl-diphosphatase